MHKSVLLDTSFFIRFLTDEDPLFKNADGYFRYFLKEEITMMICLGILISRIFGVRLIIITCMIINLPETVYRGILISRIFRVRLMIKTCMVINLPETI